MANVITNSEPHKLYNIHYVHRTKLHYINSTNYILTFSKIFLLKLKFLRNILKIPLCAICRLCLVSWKCCWLIPWTTEIDVGGMSFHYVWDLFYYILVDRILAPSDWWIYFLFLEKWHYFIDLFFVFIYSTSSQKVFSHWL